MKEKAISPPPFPPLNFFKKEIFLNKSKQIYFEIEIKFFGVLRPEN
jgi:hypothetical protein